MLRFLHRHQIDASAWDACVQRAEVPLVYALSWYLDCVAPGWCALVQQEDQQNGYSAVWPLPVKWRLGMGLVYQPPFTQQLGVFAPAGARVKLAEWLQSLPGSIRALRVQLHTGHKLQELHLPPDVKTLERLTHVLHLQQPYPQLLKGYKGNLRRAIQKSAPDGFQLSEAAGAEELIRLFRQTRGAQVPHLKDRHYALLLKLVQELQSRQMVRLPQLRENGQLVSGAVLVQHAGRLIYLFAANSARARDTSANARLLDAVIQELAGQPLLFDFEGGNIPGIGHFFRSFGAEPVPFVSLERVRLWWPLSRLF